MANDEKVKVTIDVDQIRAYAAKQAEDAATIMSLCDAAKQLHEANIALGVRVRELEKFAPKGKK